MDRMDRLDDFMPTSIGNADRKTSDLYGIREIADMLGISLRAIRFYEQKGLVAPGRDGRYRVYRESEIERLRFIQEYRRAGFSLMEIRTLIRKLNKTPGDDRKELLVKTYLDKRLSDIKEEKEILKEQEAAALRMAHAA